MEGDQYVCYQSPGNKQPHDVKQVPQFKNVQQYAKRKTERKQCHDDDHTDSYLNHSLPFAAPCS